MSFDDIMKNLQLNYLKDLESRLSSLDDFKGKIDEREEDLRTFFHQLKGSGASYGIPKVSEVGKNYEDKVKSNAFTDEDLSAAKKELEEVLKTHLS